MKKLRIIINNRFNTLDERWRKLPLKKQRHYTLCFFLGYVLVTAFVVATVCFDIGVTKKEIEIGHIENPISKQKRSSVLTQYSTSIIPKNKRYGK